MVATAKRLGIESHAQKPDRYWEGENVIEDALLDFISEHDQVLSTRKGNLTKGPIGMAAVA